MSRHPAMCSIDGCTRPLRAKGLCAPHYEHQRYHGHPTRKQSRPEVRPCLVDGCDADERVGGMCQRHYRRALAERKATVACTICEAASILERRGLSLTEAAAQVRKAPAWLRSHLDRHGRGLVLGGAA